MKYPFSTPAELGKMMSVSKSFLRDRRLRGDWLLGIHWTYLDSSRPKSGIRYNTRLCMHWLICKGTDAHEEAIQEYLKSLASEQTPPTSNRA